MSNKTTLLILTALSVSLFSCSTFDIFDKDSTAKEKETLDSKRKSVKEEDDVWVPDISHIATHVDYEADIEIDITSGEGYQFEVPESFTVNTDSLLNTWQARNLLRKLDCNSDGAKIVMTDTMYAKRLASMPTAIRMRYNSLVRSCIDRYARNRSQVSYMLGIAEFYLPIFEQEIDRMGLPQELKYLPVIESAMNPTAVSRMGAKGLWQFIFSTSKTYGLISNNYIEERYDPIKSTRAALEYLKDLYMMFGDWELALASYNCGPGNVNKAIKRSGGKTDFWEIYPWLPEETRGYVPAFIAANYIMTFYEDHGICPMEPNLSITTDTIHINKNLHFKQIVELCGADINEIRGLNPQYIKDVVPGENQTYILRLTNDIIYKFIEKEDTIYNHKVNELFPEKNIDKMLKEAKQNFGSKGSGSSNLIRHKIKKGETLGVIARKYGVTVKQIMKWNNMRNTNIRAGKTLKIYK